MIAMGSLSCINLLCTHELYILWLNVSMLYHALWHWLCERVWGKEIFQSMAPCTLHTLFIFSSYTCEAHAQNLADPCLQTHAWNADYRRTMQRPEAEACILSVGAPPFFKALNLCLSPMLISVVSMHITLCSQH